MELGTFESKLADRSLQLAYGELALPRVYPCKTDESIRVLAASSRQLIVGVRGDARSCLSVRSEQHSQGVQRSVASGRRVQVLVGPGASEKALRVLLLTGPRACDAFVGRMDVYVDSSHADLL